MGITEEGGKIATSAIDSMRGTPLGVALLVVNLAFLAFVAYVLGEISENSKSRNQTQMELISRLVTDIRDCRAGPALPRLTEMDHLLPPR